MCTYRIAVHDATPPHVNVHVVTTGGIIRRVSNYFYRYRRPAPYNDCVLWSQCGWALRREEKPGEKLKLEWIWEMKLQMSAEKTKNSKSVLSNANQLVSIGIQWVSHSPSLISPPSIQKCSSTECGPPGCECSSGYLRISVHESVCIPPEMCPAKKTIWRRGWVL